MGRCYHADIAGMDRDLEALLKALEEHWPLTPAQWRIIQEAVQRVFEAEGWDAGANPQAGEEVGEEEADKRKEADDGAN